MIEIVGIGWIRENRFGRVLGESVTEYSDRKKVHSMFRNMSILSEPVKNFGRFDEVSKNTCLAISLALFDAGVGRSKEAKPDLGILSTNEKGCLQSNIKYFKDYVECGRKLSRGNLFIYTLASTPIAESAIIFGCQGPVTYYTFEKYQTQSLLEQGRMMIEQKEARDLLIVNANEEEAICFFIKEKDNTSINGCVAMEEIQNVITGVRNLSGVIDKILQKRNQ